MMLRINREESIIAGPSSALGLLAALKVVPDEPGNVVVVIFCDNVFKYATSIESAFPEFRASRLPGEGGSGPSEEH